MAFRVAMARRVLLAALHKAAEPVIARGKITGKGIRGGRSGALRLSLGTMTSRLGAPTHPQLNPRTAAAIAGGPLSGGRKQALLAWSLYRAYYKKRVISLKKGSPIGRIRHGHLVEFGFTHRSGKQVPGTHFLEKAVPAMARTSVRRFKKVLSERTIRAIKRHNRRSPVKL